MIKIKTRAPRVVTKSLMLDRVVECPSCATNMPYVAYNNQKVILWAPTVCKTCHKFLPNAEKLMQDEKLRLRYHDGDDTLI